MKTLKYILLTLLGVILIFLVWGLVEPYFVDVEYQEAVIPNLPAAWEGQEVAQVSDWQLGMWMDNESTIQQAVGELLEEPPALVLITGDFVYHSNEEPAQEIAQAVAFARPLVEAGIPTYAVLGNHDYNLKQDKGTADFELARKIQAALEEAGIPVLENEAVELPDPDGGAARAAAASPLYLVGIRPHWAELDEPVDAVAQVPDGAPRIVMMHHPDSFAELPPHTAPLAVAGHTHGGQVRLPLLPEWTWLSFVKSDEVHADGWIDNFGAEGNRLYVNRGIGFGGAPIRINCVPEVTRFTLLPAP